MAHEVEPLAAARGARVGHRFEVAQAVTVFTESLMEGTAARQATTAASLSERYVREWLEPQASSLRT